MKVFILVDIGSQILYVGSTGVIMSNSAWEGGSVQ